MDEITLIGKVEEALPGALMICCRAEAEHMWEGIRKRFGPGEERKAVFVEEMSKEIRRKVSLATIRDLKAVLRVQMLLSAPLEPSSPGAMSNTCRGDKRGMSSQCQKIR